MAATLTLTCVKPGGGAFLVDGGRPGYRARGVPTGGPADARAFQAANRLLHRPPRATCLETTLSGGQWLFSGRGQIALTGADMNWRLNGQLLDPYTVVYLEGDGLLTSTTARRGLRSYLAINGQWQLPRILGSAEAGLPGTSTVSPGWSVEVSWQRESPFRTTWEIARHWPNLPYLLPVVPGPEWSWLTEADRSRLLQTPFTVGASSNRQGIRLQAAAEWGPSPSLLSSPVLPGTVQLSPSGPLLLGPDAQTIGGYPRVLIVPDALALGAAFQVGIGETIRLHLAP